MVEKIKIKIIKKIIIVEYLTDFGQIIFLCISIIFDTPLPPIYAIVCANGYWNLLQLGSKIKIYGIAIVK